MINMIKNLIENFENYIDPNDPTTYNNSTSITIFDDLGNPTIATIFFIRTQAASAADPTNKFETRLVINDTVIDPDLVRSVTDTQQPIFIDRFGQLTVVLGRFIPAMRAIVPFLIGMTGMEFMKFYRASILAISVWGFGLIILTTGLSSIL